LALIKFDVVRTTPDISEFVTTKSRVIFWVDTVEPPATIPVPTEKVHALEKVFA
jgi:hypothetical protein